MITQNSMILCCELNNSTLFMLFNYSEACLFAFKSKADHESLSRKHEWSQWLVNHTLTYVAKLRLWRLKKSESNIPSFSYPCSRLVYSSLDSVRRVCKEIISTLKVDGTTKQINKQKRRKECSEKFTDVECTQCVLRSAQVIFSKTMFRIRKTEPLTTFPI